MMRNSVAFGLFCLLICPSSSAQVPTGYYDGTQNLNGMKLKDRLHEIIRGHKQFSYRNLWNILRETDEDPSNKQNVILFYTGWSLSKTKSGGGVTQWNREHVWAKSRGNFGTRSGPGTDAHQLRPTAVTVNSKRGHLDFDNGGSLYLDQNGATENRVDEDSWEPRDEVKGDVARIIFYMATRYEQSDGTPDLEVSEEIQDSKKPIIGRLTTLIAWHHQDPVDDFERSRNDRIFSFQKNRNPFIDHPEFVNLIYGSTPPTDSAPNGDDPDPRSSSPTVLVVYAADPQGLGKMLADEIAKGVKSVPNTHVLVRDVALLDPQDLQTSTALILGSPAQFGGMSLVMRSFINHLNSSVQDKLGGAFAYGDSSTGGTQLVVAALLLGMMDHGMMVLGPILNEQAFPGLAVGHALTETQEKSFLALAQALGQRMATRIKD